MVRKFPFLIECLHRGPFPLPQQEWACFHLTCNSQNKDYFDHSESPYIYLDWMGVATCATTLLASTDLLAIFSPIFKSANWRVEVCVICKKLHLGCTGLNNVWYIVNEKQNKICNTFDHNFKNIPLYIMKKVSLERYYFVLYNGALTLKMSKMALNPFCNKTLQLQISPRADNYYPITFP